MKLSIAALALLAACGSVSAREMSVSTEDQANIAYICRVAVKSPAVSDDETAQLVQWCATWKARVQAANAPQQPVRPPQGPQEIQPQPDKQ